MDPLVVTRWMPEPEEDAGAGNTETEASESTSKFLLEREHRREDEILARRKTTNTFTANSKQFTSLPNRSHKES